MLSVLASPRAKLSLAVFIFVLAGVVIGFQIFRRAPIRGDINFVCVATGAKFKIDRFKVTSIPAINPKTGEATLVPCTVENGVLKVSNRYRGALEQLAEKNRYVDPETLTVRSAP